MSRLNSPLRFYVSIYINIWLWQIYKLSKKYFIKLICLCFKVIRFFSVRLQPSDLGCRHGLCCHVVSVCQSHFCIASKWVNVFSVFYHHVVTPNVLFFDSKPYGSISMGKPLMGKNHDFQPISSLLVECRVSSTNFDREICLWQQASMSFISVDSYGKENRTEFIWCQTN